MKRRGDVMGRRIGWWVMAALLVAPGAGLVAMPEADGLPPLAADLESAWQAYVTATEARRGRTGAPARFLVLDQLGGRADRQALLRGDVIVRPVDAPPMSRQVSLAGASVHHWRGAVFLPGTTVERLVRSLERRPPAQDDVLRARILSRGPSGMRVYLRLRRQQILTVVYDTEHVVHFARHGDGRASSTSRAVRLTEVHNAGAPNERALTHAEDRDFLWRLNAYWRYEDVPGGVIAECESISLSRDVPFALRPVARPLITRTAESSMRAALLALRGV